MLCEFLLEIGNLAEDGSVGAFLVFGEICGILHSG